MTTETMSKLEVAEAIAPTWERRRPQIEIVAAPVREWIVHQLAPQAGQTVLELAAGAGDTGFDVAEVLGDQGKLISTDFSPSMVEAARRRAAERHIENVEHRLIDAAEIDLEDHSVDGALCRFGYMLMSDPPAALAETRRVLRPGGRLSLAVWAGPAENPFFAIMGARLVERGHMPPPDPPPAPGIFSMANPAHTRDLLASAGFGDVRLSEIPVRYRVPGVGAYFEFVADTAGPIALVLRGLSDDDRATLEESIEESFEPFAAAGGYELPGLALGAVAS